VLASLRSGVQGPGAIRVGAATGAADQAGHASGQILSLAAYLAFGAIPGTNLGIAQAIACNATCGQRQRDQGQQQV